MKTKILAMLLVFSSCGRLHAESKPKPCDSWQCFQKKVAELDTELDNLKKLQVKYQRLLELYELRNKKLDDQITATEKHVKEIEAVANSARF